MGNSGGGPDTISRRKPHRVWPLVRKLAGQQFVQDDAKTVDVGPVIDALALDLFGTHVSQSAERDGPTLSPVVGRTGDAEIGQQRPAVAVDQDVARLDVPVDEALPVGVGQRLGDLGDQADGFLRGRAALGDAVGQTAALDELGHDEARVAVPAHVEDRHDAGMFQPCHSTSLGHEPLGR